MSPGVTSRVLHIGERLRAWLQPAADLLDLGIRLHVADVFFSSGLSKLEDWEKTVFLFQAEYHVPLLSPGGAAALGTAGEIVLPALLALGLGTRFAAAGLSFVNAVAVVSFWHVLGQNEAALNQHLYWGMLLLVPLCYGPKRGALDSWLWGRLRRAQLAPLSMSSTVD